MDGPILGTAPRRSSHRGVGILARVTGGRRWDVFVAYASPDRDRARVLHQALTVAGLEVFLDEAVLQ